MTVEDEDMAEHAGGTERRAGVAVDNRKPLARRATRTLTVGWVFVEKLLMERWSGR